MAGIPSIGGALTSSQIATQFQVQALVLQKNVTEELGEQAVQLIQSASIDQTIGQNLNLSI